MLYGFNILVGSPIGYNDNPYPPILGIPVVILGVIASVVVFILKRVRKRTEKDWDDFVKCSKASNQHKNMIDESPYVVKRYYFLSKSKSFFLFPTCFSILCLIGNYKMIIFFGSIIILIFFFGFIIAYYGLSDEIIFYENYVSISGNRYNYDKLSHCHGGVEGSDILILKYDNSIIGKYADLSIYGLESNINVKNLKKFLYEMKYFGHSTHNPTLNQNEIETESKKSLSYFLVIFILISTLLLSVKVYEIVSKINLSENIRIGTVFNNIENKSGNDE